MILKLGNMTWFIKKKKSQDSLTNILKLCAARDLKVNKMLDISIFIWH